MFNILHFFRATPEKFQILAEEIAVNFPGERTEVYYNKGTKHTKPFGKLLEHHYYISGVLRNDGALKKAEVRENWREIDSVIEELNLTLQGKIIIKSGFKIWHSFSNSYIFSGEQKLAWLSENIDPWTKVEKLYKETYEERVFKSRTTPLNDYLRSLKCLEVQPGKELASILNLDFLHSVTIFQITLLFLQLSWDFDNKYKDRDATFAVNWSFFRAAIIQQLHCFDFRDAEDGAYYLYLKGAQTDGTF